jgi:hypothetical protein
MNVESTSTPADPRMGDWVVDKDLWTGRISF